MPRKSLRHARPITIEYCSRSGCRTTRSRCPVLRRGHHPPVPHHQGLSAHPGGRRLRGRPREIRARLPSIRVICHHRTGYFLNFSRTERGSCPSFRSTRALSGARTAARQQWAIFVGPWPGLRGRPDRATADGTSHQSLCVRAGRARLASGTDWAGVDRGRGSRSRRLSHRRRSGSRRLGPLAFCPARFFRVTSSKKRLCGKARPQSLDKP